MSKSFNAVAGIVSIALALVLGTGVNGYAQTASPARDGSSAKSSSSAKNSFSAKKNSSAKNVSPIKAAASANRSPTHRLAVQVDVNDPAIMNLALNNVSNAVQHYSELGQKIDIEVVAFGPGLHMLRDDTSPVKERIKAMSEAMPNLAFSACGNTRENMTKAEAKDIPIISQATVTKSGVVRLIDLQEQGWSYLRP